MEYKDELAIRLQQYGIEPNEDIIRFIDLETIPLKAEIMKYISAIRTIQKDDKGNLYYSCPTSKRRSSRCYLTKSQTSFFNDFFRDLIK